MQNEIIPNLEVSPKVCFASPSKFILDYSLIHILKINVVYISRIFEISKTESFEKIYISLETITSLSSMLCEK